MTEAFAYMGQKIFQSEPKNFIYYNMFQFLYSINLNSFGKKISKRKCISKLRTVEIDMRHSSMLIHRYSYQIKCHERKPIYDRKIECI